MSSPFPNRLQFRSQPSRAKINECMVDSLSQFSTTPAAETVLCRGTEGELRELYEKRLQHALSVIHESGVPLARAPDLPYQAADECAPEHEYAYEQAKSNILSGHLANRIDMRQDVPARMLDIFHAACDGDWRMIELNLEAGVNIDALGQPNPTAYSGVQFEKRWTYFATPLIFAAGFGREEAVLYLVKRGANVKIQSSTFLTAREVASRRGYERIVNILEEAERAA